MSIWCLWILFLPCVSSSQNHFNNMFDIIIVDKGWNRSASPHQPTPKRTKSGRCFVQLSLPVIRTFQVCVVWGWGRLRDIYIWCKYEEHITIFILRRVLKSSTDRQKKMDWSSSPKWAPPPTILIGSFVAALYPFCLSLPPPPPNNDSL